MALYLNNVYADPDLYEWFTASYKATGKRLDMGKSCVRFRTLDSLPLELVGQAIAATPVRSQEHCGGQPPEGSSSPCTPSDRPSARADCRGRFVGEFSWAAPNADDRPRSTLLT